MKLLTTVYLEEWKAGKAVACIPDQQMAVRWVYGDISCLRSISLLCNTAGGWWGGCKQTTRSNLNSPVAVVPLVRLGWSLRLRPSCSLPFLKSSTYRPMRFVQNVQHGDDLSRSLSAKCLAIIFKKDCTRHTLTQCWRHREQGAVFMLPFIKTRALNTRLLRPKSRLIWSLDRSNSLGRFVHY